MRRYSLFMTLLFSLLLPLQVVASALLAASSCPEQAAAMTDSTAASVHEHSASDSASDTDTDTDTEPMMHDCCEGHNGKMDCQHMQNCHGCSISLQLLPFSIATFDISSGTTLHYRMITPLLALFDPAAVWRPPTNS